MSNEDPAVLARRLYQAFNDPGFLGLGGTDEAEVFTVLRIARDHGLTREVKRLYEQFYPDEPGLEAELHDELSGDELATALQLYQEGMAVPPAAAAAPPPPSAKQASPPAPTSQAKSSSTAPPDGTLAPQPVPADASGGGQPPVSDCLCATGASDRDCLIAIIDKWLGPAGQDSSVTKLGLPRDYSPKKATSCGDVLHGLLWRWGTNDMNSFFMVSETDKYDGTNTPQRGDIFILCKNRNPQNRQHVGIFYEVTGTGADMKFRSAEGGKGPGSDQQMGISKNFRGPDDVPDRMLYGWRRLDSYVRDRAACKKRNKTK